MIEYLNNDNKVVKVNNPEQVPESIMALISYKPVIPEPPHTDEQHHEIENHRNIFRELMSRCQL